MDVHVVLFYHNFDNGYKCVFPVATIQLKGIGRIDKKDTIIWFSRYSEVNMTVVAMAFRRRDLLCLC
jgi:hypothetical protein